MSRSCLMQRHSHTLLLFSFILSLPHWEPNQTGLKRWCVCVCVSGGGGRGSGRGVSLQADQKTVLIKALMAACYVVPQTKTRCVSLVQKVPLNKGAVASEGPTPPLHTHTTATTLHIALEMRGEGEGRSCVCSLCLFCWWVCRDVQPPCSHLRRRHFRPGIPTSGRFIGGSSVFLLFL